MWEIVGNQIAKPYTCLPPKSNSQLRNGRHRVLIPLKPPIRMVLWVGSGHFQSGMEQLCNLTLSNLNSLFNSQSLTYYNLLPFWIRTWTVPQNFGTSCCSAVNVRQWAYLLGFTSSSKIWQTLTTCKPTVTQGERSSWISVDQFDIEIMTQSEIYIFLSYFLSMSRVQYRWIF